VLFEIFDCFDFLINQLRELGGRGTRDRADSLNGFGVIRDKQALIPLSTYSRFAETLKCVAVLAVSLIPEAFRDPAVIISKVSSPFQAAHF
jgi:hypothetical protein